MGQVGGTGLRKVRVNLFELVLQKNYPICRCMGNVVCSIVGIKSKCFYTLLDNDHAICHPKRSYCR